MRNWCSEQCELWKTYCDLHGKKNVQADSTEIHSNFQIFSSENKLKNKARFEIKNIHKLENLITHC